MGFGYSQEMVELLDFGVIFRVGFMIDSTYQTIGIRYKKIQDVLAETLGIINVLIFIVSHLIKKYQD